MSKRSHTKRSQKRAYKHYLKKNYIEGNPILSKMPEPLAFMMAITADGVRDPRYSKNQIKKYHGIREVSEDEE